MDLKEFRKLIIDLPASEWLNNIETTVEYPSVALKQTFTGVSARRINGDIYGYLNNIKPKDSSTNRFG